MKISLKHILRGYIRAFRDASQEPDDPNDDPNKKVPLRWEDILLFLILPAIVATVICLLQISLKPNAMNLLATALSIFGALLFNLIVLLVELCNKTRKLMVTAEDLSEKAHYKRRLSVLEDLNNTIGFEIILCVVALVVLFSLFLEVPRVPKQLEGVFAFLYWGGNWLTYSFVGCFLLNLLMVLKRTHILLDKEISD